MTVAPAREATMCRRSSPREELASQRISTDAVSGAGAEVGGGDGGVAPLPPSARSRLPQARGGGGWGLSAAAVAPLRPSRVLTFSLPLRPLPVETVSDIINLVERFLGGGRRADFRRPLFLS